MRFTWGYGAVAALTLAVSVGLLDVPSRILGPTNSSPSPISLPQAVASPSAVVVTAPPAPSRPRVHARRPRPTRRPPPSRPPPRSRRPPTRTRGRAGGAATRPPPPPALGDIPGPVPAEPAPTAGDTARSA